MCSLSHAAKPEIAVGSSLNKGQRMALRLRRSTSAYCRQYVLHGSPSAPTAIFQTSRAREDRFAPIFLLSGCAGVHSCRTIFRWGGVRYLLAAKAHFASLYTSQYTKTSDGCPKTTAVGWTSIHVQELELACPEYMKKMTPTFLFS